MTDDAELIARLRALDLWPHSREAATVLDAADALEQRTRTITALEGQLAEERKMTEAVIHVKNDWEMALLGVWGVMHIEPPCGYEGTPEAVKAALTAADQRARTAEATTWEQAADACADVLADPGDIPKYGSAGYAVGIGALESSFRRRAHAAREGT
jgi:hypothetical protein